MKRALAAAPFLLFVVACDQKSDAPADLPKTPPAESRPKTETQQKPGAPTEMPRFDPLTEAKAKEILHAQIETIMGDEESRQALLYLADLKDPAGAEAARKAAVLVDGKSDEPSAAALAMEALLVYGEPGISAKVLELAKQFESDEAPDGKENLVHALGRVEGADHAAAVAKLVQIANSVEDEAAADQNNAAAYVAAVQELARLGAPEAKETFASIAANKKLGGVARGAAVAGLLHLHDARGDELAGKLLLEAIPPETADSPAPEKSGAAAGKQPPAPAAAADGPEASDVAAGLGVEGAVEASPWLRKLVDAALADGTVAFYQDYAPAAWTRIHRDAPAGPDLLAFLREWGKKDDSYYADDAARALFGVGDDGAIDDVAGQVRRYVALWPKQMEKSDSVVVILDVAARRGLATKPALRAVVDAAAQISPTKPGKEGLDTYVVAVNLAAAHAFLKSGGK